MCGSRHARYFYIFFAQSMDLEQLQEDLLELMVQLPAILVWWSYLGYQKAKKLAEARVEEKK